MIDNGQKQMLILKAEEARKNAYAPYSNFLVGAALLTTDGRVYCGCNVENAAFSPTCCAERVAIFSAISDGSRDFCAIAVVGNIAPCMPCGVCRQVMAEFCQSDFEIIFKGEGDSICSLTLGELLPHSFDLGDKNE